MCSTTYHSNLAAYACPNSYCHLLVAIAVCTRLLAQKNGCLVPKPTYTLINIHGPTAIWACVIFGLLFLLAIGLRIMYIKRHKKMKRQVNRHRAIVMASSYHRADCTKIDPERDCNCKAEQGQPGYRCPTHFDDDDAAPCGQPLWLGP